MSYCLQEITFFMDNSAEVKRKIAELWQDIASDKLALLFDRQQNFLPGISPVAEYH